MGCLKYVTVSKFAELSGYSEDAIYEATITAAIGAAVKRWNIAKSAMDTEES